MTESRHDAGPVVHPPQRERRGAARATTWWGKAWVRGLEESAYSEGDLRAARALARSGRIGAIAVDRGSVVASVPDSDGLWTTSVSLPVLDDDQVRTFVEVVAAQAGRIGSLLAGDLPHSLVEHAEESGVELLPYGVEFEATCDCDSWLDPCRHAVAVLYQVTWLIEADPNVLLHVRGVPRERLLAELHARETASPARADDAAADGDLDIALDAALRAQRVLELLERGKPVDHLL